MRIVKSYVFRELAMSDDKIVKIVGVDAESFEIFIRFVVFVVSRTKV